MTWNLQNFPSEPQGAKRELGSPEQPGPVLLGHPCAWARDTSVSTAPTLPMQGYAAGWLSPALPAAAPVTVKPGKTEQKYFMETYLPACTETPLWDCRQNNECFLCSFQLLTYQPIFSSNVGASAKKTAGKVSSSISNLKQHHPSARKVWHRELISHPIAVSRI